MNQTTVGRVVGWLAEAIGKDAVCDRDKLIELMNDIRQMAYNNRQVLEHAKPSYICVPVQCFCPACDPGYCGCSASGQPWAGVTLPKWMKQAVMIFRQGVTLPYVTRWASYEPQASQNFEWKFEDMGDTYVFERDPGCTEPFILEVMGTKCGSGQLVTASYIDDIGQFVTHSIPLVQGKWTAFPTKVKSMAPSGVRLPLDLKGPVKVRANGVDVAQWDAGEDVPTYRRIRINGDCVCGQGKTIAVKGLRRFTRLYDQLDIVEHDNRVAWVAGAQFIRTTAASKMDQAEIANAMFKQNMFDAFIGAEAAVEDTGHRRKMNFQDTFNQPSNFVGM